MYLKIDDKVFPFLEATVDDVSYQPMFNVRRQAVRMQIQWQITGRMVYGYSFPTSGNAQQSMTTALNELVNFIQSRNRPKVTLLHDDGATASFFNLDPATCIEGPWIDTTRIPRTAEDIYTASQVYQLTVTAMKLGTTADTDLISFTETVSQAAGGQIVGCVGGAINFAEKQIFKQHEPYSYIQDGSAVGLLGYPIPPNSIYPSDRARPRRITRVSPRVLYPIPQEFEIRWSDEFISPFPLLDVYPHIVTG